MRFHFQFLSSDEAAAVAKREPLELLVLSCIALPVGAVLKNVPRVRLMLPRDNARRVIDGCTADGLLSYWYNGSFGHESEKRSRFEERFSYRAD
jgi:hypothetical protein